MSSQLTQLNWCIMCSNDKTKLAQFNKHWLNEQTNEPMSSKYKQHNVIKIQTQCHQNPKSKKHVLILLLVLVLLMLLVPPPQPLASPPGNDRCDLLPNIMQGRIQLLRGHAHHPLTQKLISMGNNAANHVIGIRRASRLVPLPLFCNDLLLIWRPRNISRKKWQNLRVRHNGVPSYIAIYHTPCVLFCMLTPIGRLKRVSAEVDESLHNLSRWQLYNIRRRSRDGLDVSVLTQKPLGKVTVYLTITAHNPAWIPEYLLESLKVPVLFVRPPAYVIKRNTIKQWPIRDPSPWPFWSFHLATTGKF